MELEDVDRLFAKSDPSTQDSLHDGKPDLVETVEASTKQDA